jgi:cytochrome P450
VNVLLQETARCYPGGTLKPSQQDTKLVSPPYFPAFTLENYANLNPLPLVKAQTLGAMLRHYTWLNSIAMRLVPDSAKALIEKLWALVHEKVDRRLQTNTNRPDFLALWQMQTKKGTEGLERSEIYSNAFLVVMAGSETTATTLSGTMNHLVKNPNKLAVLTEEIRHQFKKEEDLTFVALKELTYLNAVIWEVLRMCTPM